MLGALGVTKVSYFIVPTPARMVLGAIGVTKVLIVIPPLAQVVLPTHDATQCRYLLVPPGPDGVSHFLS